MAQKYCKKYQYSTIASLAAGNFDGTITFEELLKHGDFGIGTLDHLDGELIVLDGIAYQLKSNGKVNVVQKDTTSPFASLTFFVPHQIIDINKQVTKEDIEKLVRMNIPSKNLFYAIRISNGVYSEMKTRTVARQKKPYPSLLQATSEQTTIKTNGVAGEIVGFWTPSFGNTLNVNGFHFHFINEAKDKGGHIFDFILESGRLELCYLNSLEIELPTQKDYLDSDIENIHLQKEITLAEKAKD